MSYSSVFRFLSYIMLFIAALMLIPLFIAFHYAERSAANGFLLTIALMGLLSFYILHLTHWDKELRIGTRESMLIVSLTWVVMAIFGALPLYLAESLPTYSECFFEIMSGFTTAGATVLSDIEALDRSIIFWRSMTNWLGGMGVVVLFVAVLPIFGVRGNALVGAESVGPAKSKFTPTIRGTAGVLWCIYLGLSVLQTLLLMLGGLDSFNAITVMFGTIGAAGFAALNDSIGGYGSAYVEWVCTIFMFLAGVNFAIFFYAIKRNFLKIRRNGELRIYAMITVFSTLCITAQLLITGTYGSLSEALRKSAFHVVSMMTTTGFVVDDFNLWPMFSQMLLIVVCFIGACSGSAGGGIKVIRIDRGDQRQEEERHVERDERHNERTHAHVELGLGGDEAVAERPDDEVGRVHREGLPYLLLVRLPLPWQPRHRYRRAWFLVYICHIPRLEPLGILVFNARGKA